MVYGHLTSDDDLAAAIVVYLDCTVVEWQRVAKRDEVMSALRGHDAGDDRGVEDRSFLRTVATLSECGSDVRRKSDPCLCCGNATGHILRTDINHRRAIIFVQMSEPWRFL